MKWTALLLLAALATQPSARKDDPPASKVVRVVDGDTVVVEVEGKPTTVRLIGVDAPESVHPRKPVERFGAESSKFLKGLIGGRSVRLEYEPGPSVLDRPGRTLAYLVRDDGLAVNREIVAKGPGVAYTRFPFARMEDFRAAERAAREGKLGLWGPDPPEGPAADRGATVYVTKSGAKYHAEGCRYLAGGSVPMPLGDAARTRTPCSRCRPPVPE